MFKNHPKGLLTAALSNMGERFGYYIMNAVLVLFLCSKLIGTALKVHPLSWRDMLRRLPERTGFTALPNTVRRRRPA